MTWTEAKKIVSELPADFSQLIADMKRTDPSSVQTITKTAGEIIYIKYPAVGEYELELCVKNHKKEGITLACYYLWDHEHGVVYVRDLLNPPELKS